MILYVERTAIIGRVYDLFSESSQLSRNGPLHYNNFTGSLPNINLKIYFF